MFCRVIFLIQIEKYLPHWLKMIDRCLFCWDLEDIIKIELFFSLPGNSLLFLLSLLSISFNRKALKEKNKNTQQIQTFVGALICSGVFLEIIVWWRGRKGDGLELFKSFSVFCYQRIKFGLFLSFMFFVCVWRAFPPFRAGVASVSRFPCIIGTDGRVQ